MAWGTVGNVEPQEDSQRRSCFSGIHGPKIVLGEEHTLQRFFANKQVLYDSKLSQSSIRRTNIDCFLAHLTNISRARHPMVQPVS